ncbi:MAG: zinc transporter ZupT [Planctomycetota bacterium]|jgi:zinc transporter ZupT
MLEIAGIFAVALLGGAIPLWVRWKERGLHIALALATGVFLGAVFLHLLPEVAMQTAEAALADDHGHDHPGEHLHGDLLPWLCMLVGALGVYLVEALFLRPHDHDELHRHRAVSWSALLGLAVHSLTAGMAFAVMRGKNIESAMLLAILTHKGFEAFSLTSVFQLAQYSRKQVMLVVFCFALVTPVGILLGDFLAEGLGSQGVLMLNALAAGTFLYVCLCELLAEVFHHREDGAAKMGLLAVGVGIMWFAHSAGI